VLGTDCLGASLAQIAKYLGWDAGSLRRYLDGTWRISLGRRNALEAFLDAEDVALTSLHSLSSRASSPTRRQRKVLRVSESK